jgi:glucosamine kinase
MQQASVTTRLEPLILLSYYKGSHYGPRALAGAATTKNRGWDVTRYYLGVDGGGTNCRIRLADENLRTLGEATVREASNLQIEAGAAAYESIGKGVEQALQKAELGRDILRSTYACFCMAGGRSETARDAFAGRDWPFAAVKVYDDIDAAHAGALGGEEGAVIIAGTGSAALAIVDGDRHQCGCWGFHLGDQMSGAILGRELLRRAFEAREGLVEGSPLTEAALQTLGGDLQDIMDWSFPKAKAVAKDGDPLAAHEVIVDPVSIGGKTYGDFVIGRAPVDFGAFTHLIFEYFDKGDAVAKELIDLELSYVDNYVRWFKARGAKRMAPTGGVSERMHSMLVARYGDFIVKPQGDNLSGAVILARQNFPSSE